MQNETLNETTAQRMREALQRVAAKYGVPAESLASVFASEGEMWACVQRWLAE